MRGIELKEAVTMFGVKDGFTFWFNWSFTYPLQNFWWLNISHKTYCTQHGWHCNIWKDGNPCEYPKLYNKKEILENWKKAVDEVW